MSQVQLAIFLLTVVVAVVLATRPAAPRRRRPRSTRPRGGEGQSGGRPAAVARRAAATRSSGDPFHRNHWDRRDIAAGVGRDYELSDDAQLLWPTTKQVSC